MRRAGPGAAPGPAARDLVLLADAGLVLEPDLYLGAREPAGSRSAPAGRGSFFKRLGGVLVVGAVARPGRQLAEAHRPQLPAQGLLGDPDAVLLPHPLRQIDQSPAHDTMDRRDRAALDDAGERLALGVVELGRPSRRLAIDETLRPPGIEPQHPVADRLQTDTANARRLPTRAAVVNLGKRQQAPALIRIPRLFRQTP